ncbi:hypothetical protein RISK_003283 [Rhodopirellula islandica]|uniref:Uncharacterized protein n=1 Tax=Rhodopirellula islandica TaxID=595434 RepID=A0A0J1BDS9_RHOIS|nr:hypothetical protein RISK_003283 [Rhodopirellula islandica]
MLWNKASRGDFNASPQSIVQPPSPGGTWPTFVVEFATIP